MKPRIRPIVLFFLKKGLFNKSGVSRARYLFPKIGGMKFKDPADKTADTVITYKYILQLPNKNHMTILEVAGLYDSMEEAHDAAVHYIKNDIICNYLKVELSTYSSELIEWRGKAIHPQFVAARVTRQKCVKEKRADKKAAKPINVQKIALGNFVKFDDFGGTPECGVEVIGLNAEFFLVIFPKDYKITHENVFRLNQKRCKALNLNKGISCVTNLNDYIDRAYAFVHITKCTLAERTQALPKSVNVEQKKVWGTYKYDVFLPHPKVITELMYHSTHENEEDAKDTVRKQFKNNIIYKYLKPYLAFCSKDKIEWHCDPSALGKTMAKFAVARILRKED